MFPPLPQELGHSVGPRVRKEAVVIVGPIVLALKAVVRSTINNKSSIDGITELARLSVRQSKKNDVVTVQHVESGLVKFEADAGKVRMDLADVLPDVRIRRHRFQLELGVSLDESHEFAARITAGSGDRNTQNHDYSRIIAL